MRAESVMRKVQETFDIHFGELEPKGETSRDGDSRRS